MRLSEHFSSEEFACRCQQDECKSPPVPAPTLIERLERLRTAWDHPVFITSGVRCEYWNRFVGGKPGSEHLTGEAADILCDTSQDRFRVLSLVLGGQLFPRVGVDKGFIHLGVSPRHPQQVVWVYPAG